MQKTRARERSGLWWKEQQREARSCPWVTSPLRGASRIRAGELAHNLCPPRPQGSITQTPESGEGISQDRGLSSPQNTAVRTAG